MTIGIKVAPYTYSVNQLQPLQNKELIMLTKSSNKSQFLRELIEERDRFWKETWETIARMEAELQNHKDFIKFMQEESQRMNTEALANQPELELETIRK